MKKSSIYISIGSVLTALGASLIHYGFGIMLCGIMFVVGSYFEYCKEEENVDNDN